MKRAVVLVLTALCALALVAVPAQGQARKAQTRPGRSGVCVVVVRQGGRTNTSPRSGARRSPRCRGPRGFRGPQGRAGPRGANGRTGANGANGRDGTNGSNGANGSNGRDGATGPAGPKGDKGDPGTPAGGTRYALVRDAATTSSPSFVAFPGSPGPTVTVTVPESGTIQVAAAVVAADGDGAVSLYEDGVQMAGQNDFCVSDPGGVFLPGVLFDVLAGTLTETLRFGTGGGGFSFAAGCNTTGAPGAVLFQTTPGRHTYELRYALSTCGCEPDVTFSDRRLWVTPLA